MRMYRPHLGTLPVLAAQSMSCLHQSGDQYAPTNNEFPSVGQPGHKLQNFPLAMQVMPQVLRIVGT